MKPFSKSLIVCFSILSLLGSAFLSGCSASSPVSDGSDSSSDTAGAPVIPEVEKDNEGYAQWTFGENNLGDGITINLSGLKKAEDEIISFYSPAIRAGMELFSTTDGLLDHSNEDGNAINSYGTPVFPLSWLDKENAARKLTETAKSALAAKFPDHFMIYKNNTADATQTDYGDLLVLIGQVPLTSSESLDLRVQQMSDRLAQMNRDTYEYPDKAIKATDNVYKIPCTSSSKDYKNCWWCIYKDGMLTVVYFIGSAKSPVFNSLVTW